MKISMILKTTSVNLQLYINLRLTLWIIKHQRPRSAPVGLAEAEAAGNKAS
jgi:hypothetical protein